IGQLYLDCRTMAVFTFIIAMQMAKSLHPPCGANALIAVKGGPGINNFGYEFVLFPVFTGVFILFFAALVFNNITPKRQYPAKSFIRFSRKKRIKKLKNSLYLLGKSKNLQ